MWDRYPSLPPFIRGYGQIGKVVRFRSENFLGSSPSSPTILDYYNIVGVTPSATNGEKGNWIENAGSNPVADSIVLL